MPRRRPAQLLPLIPASPARWGACCQEAPPSASGAAGLPDRWRPRPGPGPRRRSIGRPPSATPLPPSGGCARKPVDASLVPGPGSSRVPAASLGAPVGHRPSGAPPPRPALPGSAAALGRRGCGMGRRTGLRQPGAARTVSAPSFPSLLFAPPGRGHFCSSLLSVFLFSAFHLTSLSSLCALPASYPSYSPPPVFFSSTCRRSLPRPFPFLLLLSICFLWSLPQPMAASPFCPLISLSVILCWLSCENVSELYSACPHLLPAPHLILILPD